MILLPRGNPVKEQVAPGRVALPVALEKLRLGLFSGYLRFDLQAGCGLLLFQSGRMIGAWFEAADQLLHDREALVRLFASLRTNNGGLGIYRLAPTMALRLHALLHGELLHRGLLLRQVDCRKLLEQLRAERF